MGLVGNGWSVGGGWGDPTTLPWSIPQVWRQEERAQKELTVRRGKASVWESREMEEEGRARHGKGQQAGRGKA